MNSSQNYLSPSNRGVKRLSLSLSTSGLWALLALVLAIVSPAHAAFPGRNGLIAFQSQTSAGLQIFTVRPNGRDLRQITFLSGDAVAPDWSPDGRLIVFEHDVPANVPT